MNREHLLLEIDDAGKALREAQISLSNAVQQAYPVGTELVAKIGGRNVTLKVSGYGLNRTSPGELHGFNVKTGKKRQFHYSAILDLVETN